MSTIREDLLDVWSTFRSTKSIEELLQISEDSMRPFHAFSESIAEVALVDLPRLAEGSRHVLVLGETGTGKELAARRLHELSGSPGEMVAINCAALPASTIESDLFGHAEGAFTGATRARRGLVEEAEGRTLFLDEVGDMSPAVQGKLLRLLQQGEYYRMGEARLRRSNSRIIAASNKAELRPDLMHRFKTVVLPPPS